MKIVIEEDCGYDQSNMLSNVVVTDSPIQDEKDAERRQFNLGVLQDKLAKLEAMDPSRSFHLRTRIYRIQKAVAMLQNQFAVWNTHIE